MARVDYNIIVEGATANYKDERYIDFLNFSGIEDDFNPAGERTFSIFFPAEEALPYHEDGWNIKEYVPKSDPDADPKYHLPLTLRMDGKYPPKVFMKTSGNLTRLDESTVGELDKAEILNVDIKIRPYNWERNGRSGVKAYVESLYVTIEEDYLDRKYRLMMEEEVDE